MTDIAGMAIKVDSTDVKGAGEDLDVLTVAATKADDAVDDLADQVKGANKGLKNTQKAANDASSGFNSVGSKAGRAGVQIQQFVGQVQGGQNAMLALSQQAADLGIVMGAPLVGVVVSLAAAIGSVLIPQLLGAGKSAEEAAEEIRELNKDFKELGDAQRRELIKGVNTAIAEQAVEAGKLRAEYNQSATDLAKLTDQYNSLKATLDASGLSDQAKANQLLGLTNQIKDQTDSMELLEAQLETSEQKTKSLNEEVQKINGTYVDTKKAAEEAVKAQLKIVSVFDSYEMSLARRLALTSDLTEVEKVLFEIEQGRLQGITSGQQKKLTDLAAELDLQKQLKEELKQIDADEKEAAKEAKKIADDELAKNKEIAQALEDQLAGALIGGSEDGFKGVLEGFGQMLLEMAAQAVAADIIGGLFGKAGMSGGSTGNTSGLIDMIGSFAGFFDSGGNIPSGQFGIAGENGPEIVSGPANVVSTKDTAAMAGGANIGTQNFVFPSVTNANEARIAAAQAARQFNSAISSSARFS